MTQVKYLFMPFIFSLLIANSIQCAYEKCIDMWNPGSYVDHTMCLFPTDDFGPECNDPKETLSDQDKKEILDRHNQLRKKVATGQEDRGVNGGQPKGDIKSLEWDNNLAIVAQRWANQCHFGHDKCRNPNSEDWVGQNVGDMSHSVGFYQKFPEIVDMWYDEVKDFDHNMIPNFTPSDSGPVIGHYTQLVWGITTHIGCGGVKYIKDNGWYTIYLVCNYSPSGNLVGAPVYSTYDTPKSKKSVKYNTKYNKKRSSIPLNNQIISPYLASKINYIRDK